MIQKLKKTLKKRMGLKAKVKRQEFYHALKNGKPEPASDLQSAQEILKKIRNRNSKPSPYDAGEDGMMKRLRRIAGLE